MIYADGIALLASRFEDMNCKTVRLQTEVARAGMKINVPKTRTFKANCKKREIITLDGKEIEDVKTFTYLGAVPDTNEGTEADISRRLSLARIAFNSVHPTCIWKSRQFSTKTKLRLFNFNVVTVLLYGAEMWRSQQPTAVDLTYFNASV